jgi:hypothetical protein
MFLGELLFAFFMALLFTLVFTLGFKRPGPWSAWWVFFLIIFLAAWAGGLWIAPAGPVFVGIYWLPIILVAFIFAVLLASVTPPRNRQSNVETISQDQEQEATAEKIFDIFFWILLISLTIAIILGYLVTNEKVIVIST